MKVEGLVSSSFLENTMTYDIYRENEIARQEELSLLLVPEINLLQPRRSLYKERVLQNLALVILVARTFLPFQDGLNSHSLEEVVSHKTANEILIRSELVYRTSELQYKVIPHVVKHHEHKEEKEGEEGVGELGDQEQQGIETVVKPLPKHPFQILEERAVKKGVAVLDTTKRQNEPDITVFLPLAQALNGA